MSLHFDQSTAVEKVLTALENGTAHITIKETPVQNDIAQMLQEKIYTELYKIDADLTCQTLEKKHKNALVARQFSAFLLTLPENDFLEFNTVQQALRRILDGNTISHYVRETIFHCYDQLLTLQYADLYHPFSPEPPERFSPVSELYKAHWVIDAERTFNGTMEIIRYPAITLADPLPITISVLNILDEISAESKEYIPIGIEHLKTHILEVDYLVVFREKIPGIQSYKVSGMTTGHSRYTADRQVFLRAPGIIRSKNDKNGMGTILGAMIARGSVDFGKQDLLIAGFTQNKRVMDFMKMCHPDLDRVFISGFHWSELPGTDKEKIDCIIRAYTNTRTKHGNMLNPRGIAENRYPKGNKPDVEPVPIKGLPLGPDDGVFMLNTVPKNIRRIMKKHTPQTRYKNRFFGEFVKALCTIESFERIA